MRTALLKAMLLAGLALSAPAAAETIDAATKASAISLCQQLTERITRPSPQTAPADLIASRAKVCAQARLPTADEEGMRLALIVMGICTALLAAIAFVAWRMERRRKDTPLERSLEAHRRSAGGSRRRDDDDDVSDAIVHGIVIGTIASSAFDATCAAAGDGGGGGGSCD